METHTHTLCQHMIYGARKTSLWQLSTGVQKFTLTQFHKHTQRAQNSASVFIIFCVYYVMNEQTVCDYLKTWGCGISLVRQTRTVYASKQKQPAWMIEVCYEIMREQVRWDHNRFHPSGVPQVSVFSSRTSHRLWNGNRENEPLWEGVGKRLGRKIFPQGWRMFSCWIWSWRSWCKGTGGRYREHRSPSSIPFLTSPARRDLGLKTNTWCSRTQNHPLSLSWASTQASPLTRRSAENLWCLWAWPIQQQ